MAERAKERRGPKPKSFDIPCPNPRCKQHGKIGLGDMVSNGTYRARSTGKPRLFLCQPCDKAFSTRSGTAFFDLRTPRNKVFMGLSLLRGWDFEAPPECWRSSSIPSGGGWPRQLCSVSRSATCWFGISIFIAYVSIYYRVSTEQSTPTQILAAQNAASVPEALQGQLPDFRTTQAALICAIALYNVALYSSSASEPSIIPPPHWT
jgi:hypothetical protein